MTSLFETLKEQSKTLGFDELNEYVKGHETKKSKFWRLKTDGAGNGKAIIRFLPFKSEDGKVIPFVKELSYYFIGPDGQVFNEKSPAMIGLQDPIYDEIKKLWNSGREEEARARGRRTRFITNVLVISDPEARENEGKIFLYRFGVKIFEKIFAAMNPQFDDEKPINPFSVLDDGADFKLIQTTVAGFPNYDQSRFSERKALDPSLLKEGQEVHDLSVFLDPSTFKSPEKLLSRYFEVVNGKSVSSSIDDAMESLEKDDEATQENSKEDEILDDLDEILAEME